MKLMRVLLLVGVVLGGISVTASAAGSSRFPDISLHDLKKAISGGKVVLLDCNGDVAFARGHIKGAIDYYANTGKIAKLLPVDKSTLIVAYCSNPRCGRYQKGAEAAERLGYHQVKHFSPGIRGWIDAGEPTVSLLR